VAIITTWRHKGAVWGYGHVVRCDWGRGRGDLSPESLVAEIRRNARYLQDDYADLALLEPVDAGAVAQRFRAALEDAEAFIRAMPGWQRRSVVP